MRRMDIKGILKSLTEDIESISDDKVKSVQKTLLNLIEALVSENNDLREENQRLRDENNRLKGEQGKPGFRKQTQASQDISSEKERKKGQSKKKKNNKRNKRNSIKVNRIETLEIDQSQLPPDAQFKGYKSVFVQDIIITTDNIEFKKAVYYSPSLKKNFMATLPEGYQGEFGPFVRTLIIDLHKNMTEPAIVDFLNTHDVMISAATVSRFITDGNEYFHQEKSDIVAAGLPSTTYQQMDDTGARVNGKNYYTHILCNQFYTAYFTRQNKTRLTILDILTQGEMMFHFNEAAYSLMKQMNLADKTLNLLRRRNPKPVMNGQEVDELLMGLFPNNKKQFTNRKIILEASAITAYRELPHAIQLLLTDDAPQYNQIVENLALCWIHDGRHYKKLTPVVPAHIKELKCFLDIYWEYYHKLLSYKESPRSDIASQLLVEFDSIFSTTTSYDQLNERIKKTKNNKDSLLLVLQYPDLPLHNNTSELGARRQARYRDISLQTKNAKGTEAKDTHMTITETAKKLYVNTFRYLYDRISGKFEMPSLASLIKLKSDDTQKAAPA